MDDVRIVRLTSGEDVIAFFEEDETCILLGSPMTIFSKRMKSGQSFMMMTPWIPLDLVEDDIVAISYQDILTVMKPKSHIKDNYIQSLVDEDSGLQDSLNTSSYDEDFVNDDLDNDPFNEDLNNIFNKESNKTIH